MNHKGTETLESNRLILRKFKSEDADMMFQNWANDQQVTKFLTWPTHRNAQESRSILDFWISQYKDLETYRWCIVLKDNKNPIGSISVVSFNPHVESLEIGYCIGRNYWNQGFTTEAVQTVVDFLFSQVSANRIEAHIDPQNEGSGVVSIKSGFKYTGLRRQVAINNTGICDVITYEILKSDYYSF
ncbi:GNAT family N-acetyltransferase [Ruoffia tabacinasalis]|uniref:GNAT family N-acetyltransferase n=1 Tax=Ruoffia tabacinasalis TaxID=87458 RepID=A0A5R9DYH7_9LACT|nr:GNAT family N-acetyltransferase [Ruoffia tabacinasalis]TLQ41816.1 GNAT family N-acetyltransferase [Ruoffia tabacinasalis]